MTEEIIKECEFYLPFSEDCNEILDDNGNEIYKCSRRQDCYYKQLKQAENTVAELEDKIESLEQENKELKEKIKKYSAINEQDTKDYVELKRENEILKKKLDIAVGRSTTHGEAAEKYWAALEEIREIADDTFKVCDDDCGNARKIKLIIDKINEVLNLS